MSGLELARKLRRGPHAQPVIIVTADGTPDVLRDLQKAGVSQCFPKPFPIDALRRSVRQALATTDRRRGEATRAPSAPAGRRARVPASTQPVARADGAARTRRA